MSTGLTWVFILDLTSAAPDNTSGPIQFSDYNEAIDYSRWLIAAWASQHAGPPWIYVYTTSPSPSGWWKLDGGEPVFTEYE